MTTLSPDFLRNVIVVSSFRGDDFHRVCAALLLIALHEPTFDAGMLPGELVGESKTIAGIATGALISQELLEACGRVKSSSPLANGRKVNQLRIPEGRVSTVRCWLARHGYCVDDPQLEMAL